MKFSSIFYTIFLIFIFNLKCFANEHDSITLAAFYNFSGSQSALDVYSANGAKLAVDSINNSEGLLGKKLKIIFLDGKSDPNLLTKLSQDVAKNPDVSLTFGLSDTDMANAVIPPLAKAGKLFITSGATAPNLPTVYPKDVFLACFSDDKQAKVGAQFSFYNLHAAKTLVLEETNYEYAKILAKFYNESWNNLSKDKTSIKTELISKNNLDLKSITAAINTFKPDDIYIAGEPNFIVSAVQLVRSANYHKPILGGDAFDTKEIESMNGGSIYYTTHAFVDKRNPDPIVQIFMKQYEDKFHHKPDSSFAALGFDTVYLLAHAVTLAQSTDVTKVANALHKIQNYHLITGNITYLANSNIPEKTITIIHVQDGVKSIATTVE